MSSSITNKAISGLAILSAAAANLLNTADATDIASDFEFGVRHHGYKEEKLPNALGGSQDRYDIKVNQFSLIAPIADDMDLSVTYQHEKMSGASPWYTIQDGEGEVIQIMSGASIEDKRTDASLNYRYKRDLNTYGVGVASSKEDDYHSTAFSMSYARESADKMTSWSIAADVSNDDVEAVDADVYTTRPTEQQSKRSMSVFGSYAIVVDKFSLVQLALGYSRKTGYLSDPYKMVLVEFNLQGDSRPEQRYSRTASARYRYFFDAADAAFHADYRWYEDSWDVRSHTLDLAWYQNLGDSWQVVPSIRAYGQSQAFFYQNFYQQQRQDGFYSTDYRLSEYGAITHGIKVVKNFQQWSISASFEQYSSGGKRFTANSDAANPALLDFRLFSLGFNLTF